MPGLPATATGVPETTAIATPLTVSSNSGAASMIDSMRMPSPLRSVKTTSMNLPTLEDATRSPVRTTSAVGGSGFGVVAGGVSSSLPPTLKPVTEKLWSLKPVAWLIEKIAPPRMLNSSVPLTVMPIVTTGIEMSRSPVGRRVTFAVPAIFSVPATSSSRPMRSSENVLPTMLIDVVGPVGMFTVVALVLSMKVAVPRTVRPGRPSSVTVPVA